MGTNKKTSEVERIFNDLHEKILSGEMPSGHRLVESQLATAFGVSRTPARLAIERLVSAGLAEHTTNRGAVVCQISFDELRDLFRIRCVNEGLTARLASEKFRPGDEGVLYGILDQMDACIQADDIDTYAELSNKIHTTIMSMAQNKFLTDFVLRIYMITSRYHIGITFIPGRAAQSCQEHRAIVDAIVARDGDAAERAMMAHVGIISHFFSHERNRVFFRA